jgi:N-methylhydantoinase B
MKHVLSPMFLNFSAIGRRWPVRGIAGGKDGSPNRWMLDVGGENEREETGLGYLVHLPADSRWSWQLGGGGGWGDPLERNPQAVLDDVLDGYVSPEGARRDYGVVLSDDGRQLDQAATRDERAARRGDAR